jgi:YYY domain-containing protein
MILTQILVWWLILEIVGLAALPLALRLFAPLADRGYAFARPLGLLLVTYILWLGATLGFLRNSVGGIISALIIVAAFSGWLYLRRRRNHLALRPPGQPFPWPAIVASEILFTVALAGWALFKAYNPNIETSGGEKWMEFAFLNGILRSDTFPPHDPWLSGYAISYYYFGYVIMALLTRLSGLPPSVAFNLAVPTLFALTLTGAFSLVYNLIRGCGQEERGTLSILYALLGPLFVGILGNLEGLLEVLHARGLGSLAFWRWLDIKDLNVPPAPGGWLPTRFIWWWRASRVLHDRDLLGNSMEVIDEFPFFSFMLADMHPHVLALPFVLLALALALRLLMADSPQMQAEAELQHSKTEDGPGFLHRLFGDGWEVFTLYALCLGGLAFLNTWDFPIYLGITLIAYALKRYFRDFACAAPARGWLGDTARVGVGLGGLGVLLYLPFYLGFRSQAGGLLPNLLNPTRLPQFLVFFGPSLFALVSLLVVVTRQLSRASKGVEIWRKGLTSAVGTFLAPPLIMLVISATLIITPQGRAFLDDLLSNEAIRAQLSGGGPTDLAIAVLARRLANPWTFILLAALLAWAVALLRQWLPQGDLHSSLGGTSLPFVLILVAVGLALPLCVEFIYLRDVFGTRMNTVFKFYYQAWVCLGLAAAFGVYWVMERGHVPGKPGLPPRIAGQAGEYLWLIALLALIGGGLVYPLLATPDKTGGFHGPPNLDGMAWIAEQSPDDYAAIQWLNSNVPDAPVILEAPADHYQAYTYTGRVSALTGLPTLLGWGGHEHQWRGNYDIPASREPDIEALYRSGDAKTTLTLLEKYDIRYVYVGPVERERYGANVSAKFDRLLPVVYRQGAVTIYRRVP